MGAAVANRGAAPLPWLNQPLFAGVSYRQEIQASKLKYSRR
jgi:hypothetical protein